MTKKNHDVIVKAYLNKDEYEKLCDLSRATGVSKSKVIRLLITMCRFNNNYITFYDLYSHFVPGLAYVKKYPEKNREVSFYLQKEILKFDKFREEQNLLCDNDVESYEDLTTAL